MYMTLKEAAAFLHMDRETLRLKIASGKIPGGFRTDGDRGDWRISREDLERWIAQRQVHG